MQIVHSSCLLQSLIIIGNASYYILLAVWFWNINYLLRQHFIFIGFCSLVKWCLSKKWWPIHQEFYFLCCSSFSCFIINSPFNSQLSSETLYSMDNNDIQKIEWTNGKTKCLCFIPQIQSLNFFSLFRYTAKWLVFFFL